MAIHVQLHVEVMALVLIALLPAHFVVVGKRVRMIRCPARLLVAVGVKEDVRLQIVGSIELFRGLLAILVTERAMKPLVPVVRSLMPLQVLRTLKSPGALGTLPRGSLLNGMWENH